MISTPTAAATPASSATAATGVPAATAALAQAVAALQAAWAGACADGSGEGAHGSGTDVQGVVAGMTDAGLLAVNAALAAVRRHVDALHVRVAAGIADRSRPELRSEGLARKAGHRTPVTLIAATTGGHAGDAARLVQVGQATQERATFTGHRAPSRHPHVAAAVTAGTLSVAAAAAITTMLDKLPIRVSRAVREDAEKTLVGRAGTLTLDELGRLLQRAAAHLDPDGLAPVITDLHARRSVKIREDRDGMIHLTGILDPATGAPILAAVDALVTQQLRTTRGHNQPTPPHPASPDDASLDTHGSRAHAGTAAVATANRATAANATRAGEAGTAAGEAGTAAGDVPAGPQGVETRTLPQLRADALAALCRHALGCDRSGSALAATTVIVRIPLEALTAGTGVATIDGITQPVDAGTARRMAAAAEIIPIVLGAHSEILDVGRARRTFTRAQRLALAERDGGCACCGLPAAYSEAHHLRWWSHGGPTDLRNGVLLCTACHHRIHADGWDIRIDTPPGSTDPTAGIVWFIPPPHIDPTRTPRPGGRARYDWTTAA